MRDRALIVSLGRSRGTLAATRALGSAGWAVGVRTPDGGGMVGASRWCAARHVVPRPRGDGEAFVASVGNAIADGGYSVVFAGGDDWLAALATHRDDIPARIAHPDASVVDAALDKFELARRGARAGFRVPETRLASPELLASWDGPVIVKCRSHRDMGQQYPYRIETRRFPDAAAAAGRVEFIQQAGLEPVIQRPVDGSLSALIGLFHEGRLLGRVQQQVFGAWPSPNGVSTRAQTVPVDPGLAEPATALLDDLGWSGLVELQFLTGADGTQWLIDLNGYLYGSMALACAAVPGLTGAWGRQALGRPVPRLADGPAGMRFLWGAGDLRRAVSERRGGLLADLSAVLAWAPGATSSVWDRGDVGPTLFQLGARLRPGKRRPRSPVPARERIGSGAGEQTHPAGGFDGCAER
jgi:predicted ATP-grasp superfamily ATP-dependent carboligase